MTSQKENSTACAKDTTCAKEWIPLEWIPWKEPYRPPYEQATSQEYEHRQVHHQIQEQLRILRTSIDAVERIHDREIAALYRLVEERTLILSDVDEIYNDYC